LSLTLRLGKMGRFEIASDVICNIFPDVSRQVSGQQAFFSDRIDIEHQIVKRSL